MDEMVHLQKDIQHSEDIRVPIGWVGSVVMLEVTALIKFPQRCATVPVRTTAIIHFIRMVLELINPPSVTTQECIKVGTFSSRDPHLHMNPLFISPL